MLQPVDGLRRVHAASLQQFVATLLGKLSLPEDDAWLIARRLVETDLRGVSTHGTAMLGRFVAEFREGRVNPSPSIQCVRDSPGAAVIDGDGGAGLLAANRATEAAIERALRHGIGCAASRNHGHIGSSGVYARMALEHSLASFSVGGIREWQRPTKPDAHVWDAMHAPPMCFGIPAAEGPPLVLDMSANLFPQRDRLDEALVAFPQAVVKSLGLRFVTTLLGGVLPNTVGEGEPPGDARLDYTCGFLIVVIDPGAIGGTEAYLREVGRIIGETRTLPPMPGLTSAELPGSLEWERERAWAVEGIPLSDTHRALVERLADQMQIAPPWNP